MRTELHHTRGQVAKDLCVRETKASLKGSKSRLGNRFTVRAGGGSGQNYSRDAADESTLMFLPSPGSSESHQKGMRWSLGREDAACSLAWSDVGRGGEAIV